MVLNWSGYIKSKSSLCKLMEIERLDTYSVVLALGLNQLCDFESLSSLLSLYFLL